MKLSDLSNGYGHFYAPAFTVRLAGKDLVRELYVAVSQVDVELVLNEASHCSFTLVDCYDQDARGFVTGGGKDLLEILTLGAELEICIGYGDAGSTPTMMLGQVTKISTSFPESGAPELVVEGYDHGFPLTLGKNSDSWKKRKDSEVVQSIASFHHLDAVIDDTVERHPQIEQNQLNDWEFMKQLAKRNKAGDKDEPFELYVAPAGGVRKKPTLYFGMPRIRSEPVAILEWGAGLLSFRPEANLASQVSRVEVYGWDVKAKQPIVGRADANDPGGRGKSIAQHLGALVHAPDRQPTLRLRQPVYTQAEADNRAKAALGDKTKDFIKGDGECIGLPELRPGRTVKLCKLGDAFSRVYYIEQASHRVDSGGYRTRFKVREAKK